MCEKFKMLEVRKKVPFICCQWKLLCSLGGFRIAGLILLVYAWWDSFSHTHTHRYTLTHVLACLQKHYIIDREAVGGRCFALQLNKSTAWINHQIKPYLQPGRGHQAYPASLTQPHSLVLFFSFNLSLVVPHTSCSLCLFLQIFCILPLCLLSVFQGHATGKVYWRKSHV